MTWILTFRNALTAVAVAAALAGVLLCVPAASGRSHARTPQALEAIESGAEDMVDYALDGNRRALVKGAATLTTAVEDGKALLAENGVPAATIRRLLTLSTAVSRVADSGKPVRVALAANAVSALMPSIYERFAGKELAALLRLDYLDREAQLRGLAGQPGKVPGLVTQLKASWSSVRPAILARGGNKQATAFDRHVAAMVRLEKGAAAGIAREAAAGLELIDALEGVVG